MNPTQQLLRRLDDAGVRLTLVEDRLRYRSEKEPPPGLLAEMKRHRAELRSILIRRQALRWPPPQPDGEPLSQAPLSWGQRQVWATNLFVDDGRYNLSGALRLSGPLDRAAFEAAVADVYHRHASLRTTFAVEDGVPTQRVLAAVAPSFEFYDLVDDPRGFDTCVRECEAVAGGPLRLDLTPPVRTRLYRLGAADHVFAVVLHHIVADAVSVRVLLDDLARCYTARLDGDPIGPLAGRVDMRDFARYEQEFLACADLAPARRYWRELLRGAQFGRLPLPPPLGPPEPGVATLPFDIAAATTADIRQLASASQSTPFMVVAAAIAAVLSRYTGRTDLVLGMPVSRRDRPELAQLVGLLLELVPVRLDVGGNPSFVDLVRRVRSAILGAWSHAAVPVELAIDERPHLGAPLFSVVITDIGARLGDPAFRGIASSAVDLASPGAKFDLNFMIRDDLDTLHLDVEFDRHTLDPRDVRAMTGMALAMLAEAVAAPTRPVLDLAPSPSPAPTGTAPATAAGDESLTSRLAAVARSRGDAVAISHAGTALRYRELGDRVDQVARGLRHLGLGQGDVVAVRLPLGIDLVVAMLGVMGSGAACLVLDDAWPPTRAERVRRDAGAGQVVATADDPGRGWIGLPRLATLGATAGPVPAVPPAAVAYVIYTSGSTGQPKGVQVPHRNVSRLIDATAGRFGFTGADTWTLFHACSFDFSIWEIFGCLLTGGRLVLVPRPVTADPESFADLLARERVSVLNLTPSALSVSLPALARHRQASAALRYLIFGGEALDPRLVERWHREVSGQAQLVNMYGITETTIHASWHWLPPGPQPAESTIGTALPGTSLHLLDGNGGPVHDRSVGEIYVGGTGVAQGYLGQPGETARRFVPDPFAAIPGARMYRSGDLGRRDGEAIAYLGRRDSQSQVNGFRVEWGEVEATLANLPGVAAAAAATSRDDSGAAIVAVAVPEPGATLSPAALVRGARAALPRYMVPTAVAIVPALPLTANGKLDRAAVIAACGQRSGTAGTAPAPPRTGTERLLLEVFREVLHDPAVSIETDFFDRGGDSMRAVRLISLAAERGLNLSVPDVYEAPRLADLAARVRDSAPAALPRREPFSLLAPEVSGSLDHTVEDAYPVTALQLGMVYLRELAPESGVYHIVLSYRIGGRLEPAAFRAAAQAVTDRHPILRTSFDLGHPGGPIQRVHREVVAPVEFADLRGLGRDGQSDLVAQLVRREHATTFDLTRPALFRLVAVALADQDYQLIFSHHHVILDGWSVNIFFEDLHGWYAHHLTGEPAPATPPPNVIADYVAREQTATAEPAHDQFWRARLLPDAGLLAPDRAGPPAMRQVRLELRAGLLDELRALARQLGVPVKALLLATHIRVLAWLTGRAEVVTGSVISCRPESPDADRALGLFLNEFPVAVVLRDQTWAELARQAHADELAMLPHRWYPHAMIQHHRGRTPIFDTYFNFTEFHTSRRLVTDAGLDLRDVLELESSHYTLGVNYTVDVRTGELRLVLEYDESALARGSVAVAADAHRQLLEAMLTAPGSGCRTYRLPELADRARLPRPEHTDPPPGPEQVSPPPATSPAADRAAPTWLESGVRRVWAEVLGTADLDPHTSFFDAGGDSLQAMRVVSRLRVRFGDLSMASFMRAPTIADLARELHAHGAGPAAPPSLSGSPRSDRYPLTPTQRQLWQLTNQLPGLPLFGVPAAIRVDGPLDLDLLKGTFAALVERHAALRTRIATSDDGPVQVVQPHAEVRLDTVDLRSEPDPLARCEELMARAVREPMDLGQAPLIRTTAFTAADDLHVIYLNLHHAICDGWSMNVLLAEAGEIYRALSTGTAPPRLPAAPAGAGMVAQVEHDWAESAEADAQRQYWVDRLAPPWPSITQAAGSRFGQREQPDILARLRSASCHRVLPARAVAAMRAAARRSSLTNFMVILTGFASTLYEWSGQPDLRVATMTANRFQPDRESVVGLLANTVVLRLSAGADPARLSTQVKRVCLDAYERQRLPFEEVLASLTDRHPAPAGAGQLFEVMLLLQEENLELTPDEALRWRPYVPRRGPLEAPVTPTTCDFVLAARPVAGELALTLQYLPAITEAAVAEALLADTAAAIEATARALLDTR